MSHSLRYFYAPGRHGEHAETFLHGFNGTLQIDGYRLAQSRARKPGENIN